MAGCCLQQLKCCCGRQPCALCFKCPINASTTTRFMYIFYLFLCVIIMCLMLTPTLQHAIIDIFPQYNVTCLAINAGENCGHLVGYLAVYKLAFAVVIFHLLLGLITIKVTTSRSIRGGIHNGFWLIKFLFLCGLCAGSFSVPVQYWETIVMVWMYICLVGAIMYIIIQLYFLVEFAHSWTDRWQRNAVLSPNSCWKMATVLCTAAIFFAVAAGVFLLFIFFTKAFSCTANKIFIGINGGLCLLCSFVSALPCADKSTGNSRAGLLQSGVVSIYVIYLTWSAVSSEPRQPLEILGNLTTYRMDNLAAHTFEEYYCGPTGSFLEYNEYLMPFVGILIMFLSVIYSSLQVSYKSHHLGIVIPRTVNEVYLMNLLNFF
ncbi:Serine incorporator 5, variant 2 [Chamberlinius hualienensis]